MENGQDAPPIYKQISRRKFIGGLLGLGGLGMVAAAGKAIADASNMFGVDVPKAASAEKLLTSFQELGKETEPVVKKILGNLFPLFPIETVPKAQRIVSSASEKDITCADWVEPRVLQERKEINEVLAESGSGFYNEKGEYTPYPAPENITIDGEELETVKLVDQEGSSEIAFFQWVQGNPAGGYPEGMEKVEIIVESDGKYTRFDGKDFFEKFSPLSSSVRKACGKKKNETDKLLEGAGGNVSSVPIGAKDHLGVFVRAKDTLKTSVNIGKDTDGKDIWEEKGMSPLTGWFSIMLNIYEKKEGAVFLVSEDTQRAGIVCDTLSTTIGKLAEAECFERTAQELYAEKANVKYQDVDFTSKTDCVIEKRTNEEIMGLRLDFDVLDLGKLDEVEVVFAYDDREDIAIPLRALFGTLNEDVHQLIPNGDQKYSNLYDSLYSGVKFNPKTKKFTFYSNYPLLGTNEVKLRTKDKMGLKLQITTVNVKKDYIPIPLANKRFIPVYNDVKFTGGDYIITTPTSTEAVCAGFFYQVYNWQRDRETTVFPFAPNINPNWRQFYLEYNPSICRKVYDEKNGMYKLIPQGSFAGTEDMFSSFYDPQPDDLMGTPKNFQKGDFVHGGFTFHRYQKAFDDIESGIWVHCPMPTQDQVFAIPFFGYNGINGELIANGAGVRSLALVYESVCQVPNFLDSRPLSFFNRCHFEN